jgi:hypothetical protein
MPARSWLSWPVVLFLAACAGSATEAPRPAPTLVISQSTVPNPLSPPPATVQLPTASAVSVSGVIATPTPCYKIAATDRIVGTTLVIALHAISTTPHGSTCAEAIGAFGFTVESRDIPVDVSHVRVEQTGAAAGYPAVILDADVIRAF